VKECLEPCNQFKFMKILIYYEKFTVLNKWKGIGELNCNNRKIETKVAKKIIEGSKYYITQLEGPKV